MTEANLSDTLLEQDVRRTEADKRSEGRSMPLEEVIAHAKNEIEAVFSKQREKPISASR